jgi:hypothetical protein
VADISGKKQTTNTVASQSMDRCEGPPCCSGVCPQCKKGRLSCSEAGECCCKTCETCVDVAAGIGACVTAAAPLVGTVATGAAMGLAGLAAVPFAAGCCPCLSCYAALSSGGGAGNRNVGRGSRKKKRQSKRTLKGRRQIQKRKSSRRKRRASIMKRRKR